MSISNQPLDKLSIDLGSVHKEGNIPEWAGVMLACFHSLIHEVKVLNNLVNKIEELESFKKVVKNTTDVLKRNIETLRWFVLMTKNCAEEKPRNIEMVRLDDQELC